MSEILQNDKVEYEYKIFICVDEELNEMRTSVSQFIGFGYKEVSEEKDNGNTIIILSKKKEK